MTTEQQLIEWADISGISIGKDEGSPYPTLEQLAQFAALARALSLPEQQAPQGWKNALSTLLNHIEDVTPDDVWEKIDARIWNAASSLLAASPAVPGGEKEEQAEASKPLFADLIAAMPGMAEELKKVDAQVDEIIRQYEERQAEAASPAAPGGEKEELQVDHTPLLRMLALRARSFPNFSLGYHIPEVFQALGEEPPEPAPEQPSGERAELIDALNSVSRATYGDALHDVCKRGAALLSADAKVGAEPDATVIESRRPFAPVGKFEKSVVLLNTALPAGTKLYTHTPAAQKPLTFRCAVDGAASLCQSCREAGICAHGITGKEQQG